MSTPQYGLVLKMKIANTRSMPPRNTYKSKKESGESGAVAPGRKKPSPTKKLGGGLPADDDDDSVDSRGNIRGLIAYSDDEDYDSSESKSLSPALKTRIRRHARAAAIKAKSTIKKILENESPLSRKTRADTELTKEPFKKLKEDNDEVPSESSNMIIDNEEDDSDYEESESEYEDDEDDEDEDEEPGLRKKHPAEISISFATVGNDSSERMIPKRHNLKKETDIVKKFVKLVTDPQPEGGIDEQIDMFKALSLDKQEQLVNTLQKKPVSPQENLMFKILTMDISAETQALVLARYNALQGMDQSSGEYFKQRAWLEKFVTLPLGYYKDMPVKLESGVEACSTFMETARQALADAIYGQEESKLQILQFIATRIANPTARGTSLLLIGPPGIGKTCLIKNGIAKALNWPFQFISLGGDSDASTYTGHQLVYEGSHAGKIVNSLIAAKSMSMVLMFDELDKISATPKGDEVQNLMIHMTDNVQNGDFEDKYLSGVPIDLSRTMFVFSGNDISKIDKILLDRMIVIQLKGYSKNDKITIAENFILPSALKDVNLEEKVAISKDILEYIVTEYAGEEAGVRELKRCMEQITQKINMLRIFNTKDLPFYIPDFQLPFVVKKHHVDLFLKKRDVERDPSLRGMYT